MNLSEKSVEPLLSGVLYNIKLADPEEHRIYAGRGNGMILENLRRLINDSQIPVTPRIPLIPGITTTPENLQAISEFIQECGLYQCWLLPYNPIGLSKQENAALDKIVQKLRYHKLGNTRNFRLE